MHLTGTELLEWIALRRVREGGVAMHGSAYVHWGRKVPCYLPEVFDRLAEAGLLDVASAGGLRRVECTPRGRDRYQELTTKRGLSVDPEQSPRNCSAPLTGRSPKRSHPSATRHQTWGGNDMKRQRKSKAQRGLETVLIVYASHRRPHARNQEITVDVRRGTLIDTDHAAGLVAVRTCLPLNEVRIVRIEPC